MNQNQRILFRNRILWHVLFWLACYLAYAVTFGSINGIYKIEFLSSLYIMPVRIAFTYLMVYFLMPRFLFERKYLLFAMLTLLYVFLFGLAIWTVLHFFVYCTGCLINVSHPWFYLPKIFANIIMNIEIPAVFALVVIIKKWYIDMQTARELEKDKLEAELKFLKSQIHPHFLFNTLNNLYALTLKKSDKAPDVVIKLSEMLDYMLYHSNDKEVYLKDEIDLIKAYLELEKIRYGKRLKLTTSIEGDPDSKRIAPLLLLPFIENSFKHGASCDKDPFIQLFLDITDNYLLLRIVNSFGQPSGESFSEGIGLKNVQRRLEIQYKGRYELNISKNDGLFNVIFKLKWTETNSIHED